MQHPGARVEINFAGTQVLALQLFQGAHADLLASADQHWMDLVSDSGLVEGEPRVFAHNRLTVIVPAANPAGLTELSDLARPNLKLVLAAPAVPAGRYAREAIASIARRDGVPERFAERVLANVVSNEETVKGVVTKVQLGEADAGIVYVSDVVPELRNSVRTLEIPPESNVTAQYPIAVLRQARQMSRAREFLGLVLSPTGQQLLQANGFRSALP